MSNILNNLPKHRMYVELLSGNKTNLMRKVPNYSEVYNDHRNLINDFFKVLRIEELKNLFIEYVFNNDNENSIYNDVDACKGITRERWEELRQFYFDFNYNKIDGNLKRCSGFRPVNKPVEDYLSEISTDLVYMVNRLRMLQYENRPYTDILERFDGSNSLFYVDVTRVKSDGINEKELAFNLLKVKGKCIVYGVENTSEYSILIDEGWKEYYDDFTNAKCWLNFKI